MKRKIKTMIAIALILFGSILLLIARNNPLNNKIYFISFLAGILFSGSGAYYFYVIQKRIEVWGKC